MELSELNALLALSAAAPYAAEAGYRWMKRSGVSKVIVHFLQRREVPLSTNSGFYPVVMWGSSPNDLQPIACQ